MRSSTPNLTLVLALASLAMASPVSQLYARDSSACVGVGPRPSFCPGTSSDSAASEGPPSSDSGSAAAPVQPASAGSLGTPGPGPATILVPDVLPSAAQGHVAAIGNKVQMGDTKPDNPSTEVKADSVPSVDMESGGKSIVKVNDSNDEQQPADVDLTLGGTSQALNILTALDGNSPSSTESGGTDKSSSNNQPSNPDSSNGTGGTNNQSANAQSQSPNAQSQSPNAQSPNADSGTTGDSPAPSYSDPAGSPNADSGANAQNSANSFAGGGDGADNGNGASPGAQSGSDGDATLASAGSNGSSNNGNFVMECRWIKNEL